MNKPEQLILHSRSIWQSIAAASDGYGLLIWSGVALFLMSAPTEVFQIMELNKAWFADRFDSVSTVAWVLNFVLAGATVGVLGFMIHQLLEWIAGETRALVYAMAGAFALVAIFVTPLMLGDTAGTAGPMGGGEQSVAQATAFAASIVRSPLVVLMALGAASGVHLIQKGFRMRDTHLGALKAIAAHDEALKIQDDALEAQQSRSRRKAQEQRELYRSFSAAFAKQEQTRMDTIVGLAKGSVMAGEDFVAELEEGLNQGWSTFDPEIQALAQSMSPQDIDLALVVDEVDQLTEEDKSALVTHAVTHKRRFSERRIRQQLNA